MKKMLVRHLMTAEVFTLKADDDLTTLYDLMDAEHIRHIPVIGEDGELVGLVTHRDLLRAAVIDQDDMPVSMQRDLLGRISVSEIMNPVVETTEPDKSLQEAAAVMLENKYGCLPVVNGDRLVGILTEADFVRAFARSER